MLALSRLAHLPTFYKWAWMHTKPWWYHILQVKGCWFHSCSPCCLIFGRSILLSSLCAKGPLPCICAAPAPFPAEPIVWLPWDLHTCCVPTGTTISRTTFVSHWLLASTQWLLPHPALAPQPSLQAWTIRALTPSLPCGQITHSPWCRWQAPLLSLWLCFPALWSLPVPAPFRVCPQL